MPPETGPQFLKEKYDLHNSPEAESAAHRHEVITGEEIPETDADLRIQNYLDRFNEILERKDPTKHERGIEALKRVLHNKFVIKSGEIPEAYFAHQQELARELGHGDIEISDEIRNQLTEVIITDQESTLDNWVDYLSSPDAMYPDWLKYYAFRSVLGMGGFDKERHAFSKRSKGTTKPFPDLNREALAYVLDVIEKKYSGQGIDFSSLEGEERKQFEKLLEGENFAKLYAWAIEKVTPASVEQITITKGKWVKYEKGSEAAPLVESLQGHGTGWCVAGEGVARNYLDIGDFYVYYSLDQQGQPIIPRAAIQMNGGTIGQVRGIAAEQNLDPYINEVVQEKLQEFPDGKAYEKKVGDMKTLTFIEKKVKAGQDLSKNELIFLYEINSTIEGFGYQRDPRIEELRSQRDPKADAPVVLECEPQEIAWGQGEVNEETKSYIGPLFPGVFELAKIEHFYTTFPEAEISQGEFETTGKTGPQLKTEVESKNINLTENIKFMYQSPEFIISPAGEKIQTVHLKVRDLFSDDQSHNYDQIVARAKALGLDLLPHETASNLILKEETQPKLGEWFTVASKTVAGRDGHPHVFYLGHRTDGLCLRSRWTDPAYHWIPDDEFLFRLRKLEA